MSYSRSLVDTHMQSSGSLLTWGTPRRTISIAGSPDPTPRCLFHCIRDDVHDLFFRVGDQRIHETGKQKDYKMNKTIASRIFVMRWFIPSDIPLWSIDHFLTQARNKHQNTQCMQQLNNKTHHSLWWSVPWTVRHRWPALRRILWNSNPHKWHPLLHWSFPSFGSCFSFAGALCLVSVRDSDCVLPLPSSNWWWCCPSGRVEIKPSLLRCTKK